MKVILPIIFLINFIIVGCNVETEKYDIVIEQKEVVEKTVEVVNMKLTSPAFEHNQAIPSEYTCDGTDTSPELDITDVPQNAKSLVLINDDPDAPVGTWDHWIVFNIHPSNSKISKGQEPSGTAGKNSWGKTGYGGPCPPSGTHRYFFKLYALDTELGLQEGATKEDIEAAMEGHIIEKTELIGTYKKE